MFYDNWRCFQVQTFRVPFDMLFSQQSFDVIIEIGTAHGGLTTYLADMNPEVPVHTFDIKKRYKGAFTRPNITQHIGDVFANVPLIEQLMQPSTLLLCDGGNKEKEWQLFGPMLSSLTLDGWNPRSYCLVHDYREDATKDSGWPCESHLGMCPDSMLAADSLLYESFRAVAWGLFIRSAA